MDKILGDIPHTFSHLEDILISLKEEHMVDLKSLKPWKTCILGSLLSIRLFTTFRHMVEGRPFILYTDHQNLVPSMVIKTARQMNQLSEIVEDSTDISYLKGKSDFGDWRINAVTMNQLQIHNCRFVPVVLRHLERCFETGTCNRLSTGCECSWLIVVWKIVEEYLRLFETYSGNRFSLFLIMRLGKLISFGGRMTLRMKLIAKKELIFLFQMTPSRILWN